MERTGKLHLNALSLELNGLKIIQTVSITVAEALVYENYRFLDPLSSKTIKFDIGNTFILSHIAQLDTLAISTMATVAVFAPPNVVRGVRGPLLRSTDRPLCASG